MDLYYGTRRANRRSQKVEVRHVDVCAGQRDGKSQRNADLQRVRRHHDAPHRFGAVNRELGLVGTQEERVVRLGIDAAQDAYDIAEIGFPAADSNTQHPRIDSHAERLMRLHL